MNKGLKNKGLGSWFCLAAALVALITGIVFLLTQATAAPLGHSGTMAGVVLLVGAAASLVFFFVSVPFSALIQAVIYNIALYLVVVQLYFVFADVINHVTFAGGNAGLCVFYMVGTFIACLLSVIACFCKQTKTGEAKATGKQFAAAGAVVVVAAVCVGGFSLQSSSLPSADNAEVAPDAAQTSAEGPVMNYSDNEFTSKTLDDLVAIPQETWEAKEPNGEVAYFFEGQYTEGFSTIVDPACLDKQSQREILCFFAFLKTLICSFKTAQSRTFLLKKSITTTRAAAVNSQMFLSGIYILLLYYALIIFVRYC